jgi:hypothetical protein
MSREIETILQNGGLEQFGLYYSTYQGTVRDNNDPEKRGRLKIDCPAIYEDGKMEEWVEPRGMPSGVKMGLFILPQKGDLVWISCREGNPLKPVWEFGAFKENSIPDKASSGYPKKMVLQYGDLFLEFDSQTNKLSLGNDNQDFKSLFYEFIDMIHNNLMIVTMLGPQSFAQMPSNLAHIQAFKVKFEQLFK